MQCLDQYLYQKSRLIKFAEQSDGWMNDTLERDEFLLNTTCYLVSKVNIKCKCTLLANRWTHIWWICIFTYSCINSHNYMAIVFSFLTTYILIIRISDKNTPGRWNVRHKEQEESWQLNNRSQDTKVIKFQSNSGSLHFRLQSQPDSHAEETE